jgi:hypothetical protein
MEPQPNPSCYCQLLAPNSQICPRLLGFQGYAFSQYTAMMKTSHSESMRLPKGVVDLDVDTKEFTGGGLTSYLLRAKARRRCPPPGINHALRCQAGRIATGYTRMLHGSNHRKGLPKAPSAVSEGMMVLGGCYGILNVYRRVLLLALTNKLPPAALVRRRKNYNWNCTQLTA